MGITKIVLLFEGLGEDIFIIVTIYKLNIIDGITKWDLNVDVS